MWFWLIFAALANRSLIPSMAEPVGNELPEDVPDDSMYLYMEERSLKDPKPDPDEIKTLRRSPLDMNFMRFGRRDYSFPPINLFYNIKDMDYSDDISRPLKGKDNLAEDFVRARRDSYKTSSEDNSKDSNKRVGKGKDYTNFVRFGRNFYANLAKDPRVRDNKFGKRRDYTDFIRFGRNPFRDINDIYREDKRHTNTMRFGKKSTGFMRFG